MKMYEIQRLIQEIPKTSPNVEISSKKSILIRDIPIIHSEHVPEPIQINKPVNKIPWGPIITVIGIAINLLYLYDNNPKNQNYQSFTQKRRSRREDNV